MRDDSARDVELVEREVVQLREDMFVLATFLFCVGSLVVTWLAYSGWPLSDAPSLRVATGLAATSFVLSALLGIRLLRTAKNRTIVSKLRIVTLGGFGVIYLALLGFGACFLAPLPLYVLAVLVVVMGLALRQWSARYQRRRGADVVLTSGPYGLMRHPRYVGTIICLVGVVGTVETGLIALAIWSLFPILIHIAAGLEEEAKMRAGHLATDYAKYAQEVPAWVPSPRSFRNSWKSVRDQLATRSQSTDIRETHSNWWLHVVTPIGIVILLFLAPLVFTGSAAETGADAEAEASESLEQRD